MRNEDCKLCRIQKATLARTGVATLVRSPYWHQWPGALMLVARRHVTEQTDLRPAHARETYLDLLDAERALRRETGCDRVNVAKFGNVTRHLHWHLIPRYLEEAHPKLTPWEIGQLHPELEGAGAQARSEAVYAQPRARWSSQGLLQSDDLLHVRLSEDFLAQREARPYALFGAAFFLRPCNPARRAEAAAMRLPELVAAVRAAPTEWESLLMQRNYLDRTWDNVGGNGEAGEFPEAVMRREVSEELGWDTGESLEACRQWTVGLLRGFVYVTRPREGGFAWMSDDPERIPCDEVADLRFLNVAAVAEGRAGVETSFSVADRHAALIEGKLDFCSASS